MENLGFKVTDKDMACRGFQYIPNILYRFSDYSDKKIQVCSRGFHFCKELADVDNYYKFGCKNNRFFIVRHGENFDTLDNKSVSDEITFLDEITVYNLQNILDNEKYKELVADNLADILLILKMHTGNYDFLKSIKRWKL